jgi:transposase
VSEVTTIGLDIAKNVFHAHGADERGRVVFSKRISRGKLLEFFAAQPSCMVALEACGGAHHWARQLIHLGHQVRLIPPAYVKPFVKRHKNDAVDAEAICEAAQRPSMRFVAVKDEEQQAAGLVFRTRDLLVKQRTQLINAIRGHLSEYGWVAPKGPSHVAMLADLLEEEEMASTLPEAARAMLRVMLDLLGNLDDRIKELDKEIARRAREDEVSRRLMTIPGIGPIGATAITALAPPAETLQKAATSPHGSASRRSRNRQAANKSSARRRRWANAHSGACSSSAAARSCSRRVNAAPPRAHGSNVCWLESLACW